MYNKSKSIRHGGERLFERLGPEDIQHGTDQFNYAIYRHDPKNYEYTFDTHWHEEYEIIYVKDGVFHYLIDGQEYCVKKGESLFLDQCAIHTFLEYPPRGAYVSFLFGKKFVFPASSSYICQQFYAEILPQRVSLTQLITEEEGWRQQALSHIRRLDSLSNSASENALPIQISLLTILDLLRREKSYTILQNHLMVQNASIREALLYIHQHYDEKLSVHEIAGALHISTDHFIRLFKFMLGMTPQKYIQTYRIKQAAAAIRQISDDVPLSISEIAAGIGFSDANYFTRSFKKVMGITPSQYQKMILKN